MVRARSIGNIHRTVSISVHARSDIIAGARTILIVMDLVRNLVLEGIRFGSKRLSIPGLPLDEVGVVEIVIQAREEDQGVGVVAMHCFGRREHVFDPCVPGVRESIAGGFAKLVAEADGCEACPGFGLQVVSEKPRRFGFCLYSRAQPCNQGRAPILQGRSMCLQVSQS
jgi:hypothetical protein